MRAPVVLLDIDGVCADFISASLAVLRRLFGLYFRHDDVTTWNLEDSLKLTETQRARMMAEWSRPGFCRAIPPYDGALEGVIALRELGCDVYAVTAPMWSSATWMAERTDWVQEHLSIQRDKVIHTSAKHLVRGDLLVEDKVSTLADWAAAHPDGTGLLFGRAYNAGDEFRGQRVVRVNDWAEAVSLAEAVSSDGALRRLRAVTGEP